MPTLSFTTRIPLAVMIAMGIKRWENRSAMPEPRCGRCGMTCSKSSDEREYSNFFVWAENVFPENVFQALPVWEQVQHWSGTLIATCDYEASYTPGDRAWDEGYPVWWHLSNVQLLKEPIPCRGSVGMWKMPEELINHYQELTK